MKKIILTVIVFVFSVTLLKAQYVNIPDTNFRKYLFAHFPGAMLGNNMDTTHPQITGASVVDCDSLFIRDLSGIQYFDNLLTLSCKNNILHSLPPLPAGLQMLHCSTNQLDSLPSPLPPNIVTIYCNNNRIKKLPFLPASIISLDCSLNMIDTIDFIPPNAQYFSCSVNSLDSLPLLPASLKTLNYASNNIVNNQILPMGLEELNCSQNPIYVLPVLNPSLKNLMCSSNFLTALPNLPATLQLLICSGNQLPTLPALPNQVSYINCSNNVITLLPVLPNSLRYLHCSSNQLSVLPFLPNGLEYLFCANNGISNLPVLPASLLTLDYSANPVASLPLLPGNLTTLYWNNNNTNILPAFPASLKNLFASYNNLDSLPVLPSGMHHLTCNQDSLTFLPVMPSSLSELEFNFNQLTAMPVLPPGLKVLFFANNLISVFNTMPLTVDSLNCSGNTNISCLPKIPSEMKSVGIDNTSITCLPNHFYIKDTFSTSPAVFTLPLCTPAGACICAWNIAGNTHALNGSNCGLDSLNPGSRVQKLKAKLYKNNILIDEMTVTVNGEYSFDTGISDTLDVVVDTAGIPLKVACPVSTFHHIILSPADSMKGEVNFAMQCNDIDAGVDKIMGRFRPTFISHININAGDLAQTFNVICNAVNPGIVTTVLQGPVSYMQPSANALTPTNVIGNMLVYNVPDLSAVDYKTAFDIEVATDMSATIGDQICVRTAVSNVANDIQPLNDEKEVCFPVVTSYDPNAKFVFPKSESKPGDLLNYTIQFQNTGNDTAFQVVIRDTLSNNLDWNSFKFTGSSHAAEIVQNGRYLTFNFFKINLLDSVSNEPESHGWLQYNIKLKDDLGYGAKTDNRASIYFDINPPIVTNTATNFVGHDTTYEGGSNPYKVPNAISPNGDNRNETWALLDIPFIERKHIQTYAVQVFNRWGIKVYSGYGTGFKWAPSSADAPGNYTYTISYRTVSGNEWIQRGTILLVR